MKADYSVKTTVCSHDKAYLIDKLMVPITQRIVFQALCLYAVSALRGMTALCAGETVWSIKKDHTVELLKGSYYLQP